MMNDDLSLYNAFGVWADWWFYHPGWRFAYPGLWNITASR
jgi:hypothetical protein